MTNTTTKPTIKCLTVMLDTPHDIIVTALRNIDSDRVALIFPEKNSWQVLKFDNPRGDTRRETSLLEILKNVMK